MEWIPRERSENGLVLQRGEALFHSFPQRTVAAGTRAGGVSPHLQNPDRTALALEHIDKEEVRHDQDRASQR